MLLPLLALAMCVFAALSGAVLVQPLMPAVPLTVIAGVLFAASFVPSIILSGDWLWMNGKRRSGPPRGQIMARLALFVGVVGLVLPLVITDRPVLEHVRVVPSAWAAETRFSPATVPSPPIAAPVPPVVVPAPPVVVAPPPVVAAPDPTIKPTPADAEFPTIAVVLEAKPMQVIDTPKEEPKLPEPEAGTFFVYEWKDPQGTTHWCNVFEEIPPEGKIVKATVMKPVEPTKPPSWVTASAPRTAQPSAIGFMNDPRLPSYAEQHWRSQFKQSHSRIRNQEKRIAEKQKEFDNAPVRMNRQNLEDELRAMKKALEELQQEDNDLEREASYRAVPREWRN
jgi:hypothetical protein